MLSDIIATVRYGSDASPHPPHRHGCRRQTPRRGWRQCCRVSPGATAAAPSFFGGRSSRDGFSRCTPPRGAYQRSFWVRAGAGCVVSARGCHAAAASTRVYRACCAFPPDRSPHTDGSGWLMHRAPLSACCVPAWMRSTVRAHTAARLLAGFESARAQQATGAGRMPPCVRRKNGALLSRDDGGGFLPDAGRAAQCR